MEASFCQTPFAFLYDNHPRPGEGLLPVCLAMLAGAIFPGFFRKEEDLTWPFRLYMGLAGLLGLGPLLFGKGGAALYPVFFAVASVMAFSPLRWAFRGEPKSGAGHSSPGEALASDAFQMAGTQAFLQLLALNSVAAASLPLFWLWAVPLILAALLALWRIAFYLLIQRPFDAAGIIHGLLVLLVLGYLGRLGAVNHYGVPVPGSFWEAPAYTVEAMAKVEPYGEDAKTGRQFRARVGVKVGSSLHRDEGSEGQERLFQSREGRILWIEVAGIKRPIIEQDEALDMNRTNHSVLVRDSFGKSYRIADKLDFKDARKP